MRLGIILIPLACAQLSSNYIIFIFPQDVLCSKIVRVKTINLIIMNELSNCLYHQAYSVHGLIGEKFLPLVYALLPNKKKSSYNELFNQIKGRVSSEPEFIILDFEKGAISSLENTFLEAEIQLCFFHFAQSMMRTVQNKFR